MANPRKPLYDLVRDSTDRVAEVELGEYFMMNNGKIVWKANSQAVSSRWVKAIAEALETSVEELSVMAEFSGGAVKMIIPDEYRAISAALGNYFEYCFWDSCFRIAAGEGATVTVEEKQVPNPRNELRYINMVSKTAGSVTAKASKSFADRGLENSWITQTLTPEERGAIQEAANKAADSIIQPLKAKLEDDSSLRIEIEAVAGSATMGDVIVKALNSNGTRVAGTGVPILELKYYSSDTITWSTLSDINFDMKFSSFLRQYHPDTDWSRKEGQVTWVEGLRTTGFANYVNFLKARHGDTDIGLFRYFLAKGKHQDNISTKRAVIVNSNSGQITITTNVAALARRLKQLRLNFEGGVARFSRVDAVVGTFNFTNPADLAKYSKEKVADTKIKEWSTSFRFQLTKAFYDPSTI